MIRAAPGRSTPTWQLYQALAAMWAAMAITNEDTAARCGDPVRADLFEERAARAREHARRLQARADRLRRRRTPDTLAVKFR
ncbi:hypothetical protein [Amycolatopsis sp. NPDC051371]|uniref:hypothetical protein n=1 Tax=Amycolatopsis sp. NPDC051371 TaxID=3155800 RepID=UPI00341843D8